MSPFLAMSDAVMITTLIISTGIPAFGGMIVSIIVAVKANANAAKSQANQQAMVQQVQKVQDQSNSIHGLVNSAMVEQKRIALVFAKRAAEMVDATPKDKALADEAQKIYDDAVINAAKVLQSQKTQ